MFLKERIRKDQGKAHDPSIAAANRGVTDRFGEFSSMICEKLVQGCWIRLNRSSFGMRMKRWVGHVWFKIFFFHSLKAVSQQSKVGSVRVIKIAGIRRVEAVATLITGFCDFAVMV